MNQEEPVEVSLRFDKLVGLQRRSATHKIWRKKILSHFLALSIMVQMFLEKRKWPSPNHLTIVRTITRSRGALPQMRFTDSEKGNTTTSTKITPQPPPQPPPRLQLLTPSFFYSTGGGDFSWPNFRHQYHGPRMPPPSNNAVFMTAFINKRES